MAQTEVGFTIAAKERATANSKIFEITPDSLEQFSSQSGEYKYVTLAFGDGTRVFVGHLSGNGNAVQHRQIYDEAQQTLGTEPDTLHVTDWGSTFHQHEDDSIDVIVTESAIGGSSLIESLPRELLGNNSRPDKGTTVDTLNRIAAEQPNINIEFFTPDY